VKVFKESLQAALVMLLLCCTVESAAGADGLNCLVHPYASITISTPVVGVLETIPVDRGDVVKAGQIVATLDSSVERAHGAVAYAQAELSNQRLADLEWQQTVAEVGMRTIRSPINGVVVERLMSPGEFPKQEPILKLAQIHPLRVEAFAPLSLFRKVVVGMEAVVRLEEPVGGSYKAKVTVVDRVVQAASGTFGIRLDLPNPELRLPAGVKCTVVFPNK
jgi:membrane fusion protein, multidrug efflux system